MTAPGGYWIVDRLATERAGGRRSFFRTWTEIGPAYTRERDRARVFRDKAEAKLAISRFPVAAAVTAKIEEACTCQPRGLCENCEAEMEAES